MRELLYVGKFYPWDDSNEEALYEALKIFDSVKICVMIESKSRLKKAKVKKGQPTKILDPEVKDKVTIIKFKRLKTLLNLYKDNKYIMFER